MRNEAKGVFNCAEVLGRAHAGARRRYGPLATFADFIFNAK